jgi:hypothetical protein
MSTNRAKGIIKRTAVALATGGILLGTPASTFVGNPVAKQAGILFREKLAYISGCGPYVYALKSASIDYGDGTPSETGGFVGPASEGAFYGAHTYQHAGKFTIQISVVESCFNNSTSWDQTITGSTTATIDFGTAVEQVNVTPEAVQGGRQTFGNLVLAKAAPQSGTVVFLSSSNPELAKVPAVVSVPAGQTNLTKAFVVETKPVGRSPQIVRISAYSGGVLKVTNVTIR